MRIDAPMESVVKQAGTASHPCLVTRDAKMDRREFRQGLWVKESIRLKRHRRELIERTYDYVTVSEDLLGKIENAGVVEDFESRPYEAVTFQVV